MRNIINAHKEGEDGEIEKAIIDYFNDKRLNEMLNTWKSNPKLKIRIHILRDAVLAHMQGKYTLSVPALLPQIEGIIIENSGRKGWIRHREITKIFNEKLGKNSDGKKIVSVLSVPICNFLEDLLKENFEWGQPTKAKAARHPILHGFFVTYDTQTFSLKLILLIDYIQSQI